MKDLQVLAIAAVLLYLLVRFENWRYWYPVTLPVEFSTSVEQLSEAFGRRIQWASNGQYGGFLKAVLLADKSDLPASTLDIFRDLGISHVLAVSGFHIGFWVMLLRPFFSWVRGPKGKVVAHVCQCMLLFVYAHVVGGSPSVLRAVWMYSLARLAILQQWRIPSLHFPMIVAIGHYFVNPAAPRTLSFQLSYTAVFAILLALLLVGMMHRRFAYSENALSHEKAKSERLLRAILPETIAKELRETGKTQAVRDS